MEHAIAEADDGGTDQQICIARADTEADGPQREARQAAEQRNARPEAVDHEAGDRLTAGRDHEDHGHHKTKRGVA